MSCSRKIRQYTKKLKPVLEVGFIGRVNVSNCIRMYELWLVVDDKGLVIFRVF